MTYVDWRPGMSIRAADLRAITPQPWTTWGVAWTTSGASTPSLGSGSTVVAEYTTYGANCTGKLEITFAGGTTFGSGGDNWRFSSPVTAASTARITGYGEAEGGSTSARIPLRVRLTSTNFFELEVSGGRPNAATVSAGLVDDSTPWSWMDGHSIRFFFTYPIAT